MPLRHSNGAFWGLVTWWLYGKPFHKAFLNDKEKEDIKMKDYRVKIEQLVNGLIDFGYFSRKYFRKYIIYYYNYHF